MYYGQQHCPKLADLYLRTLERCLGSGSAKLIGVALQQIASHLSEIDDSLPERQRLIACLGKIQSHRNVPESHRALIASIQSNKQVDVVENIDLLLPYRARYLDLRREFRDSTQYLIDGDSLVLFVAHHINVDLLTFHGNTLHAIFIIERILLTLFHQARQCNYTLVFFDCHYECYAEQRAILGLLRASLIAHLTKNADQIGSNKVRRFATWLAGDYSNFIAEEKPHFVFYYDLSGLVIKDGSLLSANALAQLHHIYRLFGNHHQFRLNCHLYLMNKLRLTNTVVKCFRMEFLSRCFTRVLPKSVRKQPKKSSIDTLDNTERLEIEQACQDTGQNDVRLFIYLQTIRIWMKQIKVLSFCVPLIDPRLFSSLDPAQGTRTDSSTQPGLRSACCFTSTSIPARSSSPILCSVVEIQSVVSKND